MKLVKALSAMIIGLFTFSPVYASYYIDYSHGLDSQFVPTTTQTYASVWDFGSSSRPSVFGSISGNSSEIVSGSMRNRYAAPFVVEKNFSDPTPYLSVAVGSITIHLSETANYLGFLWGSIDTYNSIAFLKDGVGVASFTGSDIANPANGDQRSLATNTYVNFYDLPAFDSFRLTSTGVAFEIDNLAVGTKPVPAMATPEPSAFIFLGTGLVFVMGLRRFRKS